MRRALVLLLILCAPCASATAGEEQIAVADTIWSAPITLAQAPQAHAPAFVITGGQTIAAWVGADERGVHQDARRSADDGWSDPVTLPLPPTHPYDQRLFPGASGGAHLLWLDAGAEGTTNLYSALLSPDLSVERGPVSVSEGLALSYSAVPDGAGGLWTAWRGGMLAEMSVFVRRVDDEGRPLLETTRVAENAADPALVRAADGAVWLFWTAEGQLMRLRLEPEGDVRAQALTGAISRAPGDRLISVRAALDATTAYFFWNVTRADDTSETWMTAGSLTAANWPQPQRLTIAVGEAAQVDSGLKSGSLNFASSGGQMPLRWLEPSTGQRNVLVAAVEIDDGLGIIVLSGGQVVGYATIVPGVRLIGLPALAISDSGDVELAWSSAGAAYAELRFITTRKSFGG